MTTQPDCLFCRIILGEIPSTKVYEDDTVLAFRDIEPAAPVHVLIVPKSHIASLDAVQKADAELTGRLMLAAAEIARQEGIAESGYRVITNIGKEGGQSVDHLHLHLLGGRQLSTLGL
jgi:histidine triad (HIT) family protein